MAQGVHQAVKSTKLGAGKGRISHVKKTQQKIQWSQCFYEVEDESEEKIKRIRDHP